MGFLRGLLRFLPQRLIKINIQTSSGFAIEKSTRWNVSMEHFFQAHRLRAKLNLIAIVRLGFSSLYSTGNACHVPSAC